MIRAQLWRAKDSKNKEEGEEEDMEGVMVRSFVIIVGKQVILHVIVRIQHIVLANIVNSLTML